MAGETDGDVEYGGDLPHRLLFVVELDGSLSQARGHAVATTARTHMTPTPIHLVIRRLRRPVAAQPPSTPETPCRKSAQRRRFLPPILLPLEDTVGRRPRDPGRRGMKGSPGVLTR